MIKLIGRINRWFDLNIGFLFVNGRKMDQWLDHINKKYNDCN